MSLLKTRELFAFYSHRQFCCATTVVSIALGREGSGFDSSSGLHADLPTCKSTSPDCPDSSRLFSGVLNVCVCVLQWTAEGFRVYLCLSPGQCWDRLLYWFMDGWMDDFSFTIILTFQQVTVYPAAELTVAGLNLRLVLR